MLVKGLKRKLNKRKFGAFDKTSTIGDNVNGFLKNVFIGKKCYIGDNVFFNSFNRKVIIDSFSIIADNVLFITGNHKYDVVGKPMIEISENEKDENDDADITIEKDVWIGSNCIILKGITIHSGAIVGAGSVVTKDVDSCTIVAGNPAKFIRNRFDSQEKKELHLRSLECLD